MGVSCERSGAAYFKMAFITSRASFYLNHEPWNNLVKLITIHFSQFYKKIRYPLLSFGNLNFTDMFRLDSIKIRSVSRGSIITNFVIILDSTAIKFLPQNSSHSNRDIFQIFDKAHAVYRFYLYLLHFKIKQCLLMCICNFFRICLRIEF